MEKRHVSRIVVDLLLERKNELTGKTEILMLFANYLGDKYDLPGGHIESGEDIFDAIIREAKEEVGIDIKREDLKIVHIYHHYKKDVIKFVFKAEKYSGKEQNIETEKCEKIEWIDIDNLPEDILPAIKFEIDNIKSNVYYSYDY